MAWKVTNDQRREAIERLTLLQSSLKANPKEIPIYGCPKPFNYQQWPDEESFFQDLEMLKEYLGDDAQYYKFENEECELLSMVGMEPGKAFEII